MSYDRSFGQWLVARRKELRLQRTELASQLGCAVITLRKIESDERRPSQQLAELLAERLGLGHSNRATFIRVARGELLVDRLPALPLADHAPPAVHHAIHPSARPTPRQPSHPTIRTNLPAPLTSFVGRHAELATIPPLLDAQRLVTLTGVGGVGKTRLALELGLRLVKEASAEIIRDGVWLVELAALAEPTLMAQAIAQLLHVPDQAGRSPVELLQEYFADKQLLLILDNCEHLVDVCAELAEQLLQRCWQLRILATSREPLRIPGELAYPVVPLSLPADREHNPKQILNSAAAQLFIARMHTHPGAPNADAHAADAIAQICRQLDGIPLALELAAPLTQSMPLAEIATQLHNQMNILTNTYRTAIPRHQTMHSALIWSYRLLGHDEQVLLASVAVFAGGWTLEAAQAICAECPPERVRLMLHDLIAKSLVLQDEAHGQQRYRLLEPVRQFAVLQLQASGLEQVVRRRHAEYFVSLAVLADIQLHSANQLVWLDTLEQDHDNLRVALAWLVHDDPDDSLKLSGALIDFWHIRGYLGEGRQWLARALNRTDISTRNLLDTNDSPSPLPDSIAVRAKVLRGAGLLAHAQEDNSQAEALFAESLTLARALHDSHLIVRLLNNLGELAYHRHATDQATSLYTEGLMLARSRGDQNAIAGLLLGYGEVEQRGGNSDIAASCFEESLLLFQSLGDMQGSAWAFYALGRLAMADGNYKRAEDLFTEGLMLSRSVGAQESTGWILLDSGLAALEQHDMTSAVARFAESIHLMYTLGAYEGIAENLDGLATILIHAQQFADATKLLSMGNVYWELTNAKSPIRSHVYADHSRTITTIRTQLDEEIFAAAWEYGASMSLEQAVAYALELQP